MKDRLKNESLKLDRHSKDTTAELMNKANQKRRQKKIETSKIEHLRDILIHIFKFCTPHDLLLNCSKVCKEWYNVIRCKDEVKNTFFEFYNEQRIGKQLEGLYWKPKMQFKIMTEWIEGQGKEIEIMKDHAQKIKTELDKDLLTPYEWLKLQIPLNNRIHAKILCKKKSGITTMRISYELMEQEQENEEENRALNFAREVSKNQDRGGIIEETIVFDPDLGMEIGRDLSRREMLVNYLNAIGLNETYVVPYWHMINMAVEAMYKTVYQYGVFEWKDLFPRAWKRPKWYKQKYVQMKQRVDAVSIDTTITKDDLSRFKLLFYLNYGCHYAKLYRVMLRIVLRRESLSIFGYLMKKHQDNDMQDMFTMLKASQKQNENLYRSLISIIKQCRLNDGHLEKWKMMVNQVDHLGLGPLHYAIMYSMSSDIIGGLLSLGADPNKMVTVKKTGVTWSPYLEVCAGSTNLAFEDIKRMMRRYGAEHSSSDYCPKAISIQTSVEGNHILLLGTSEGYIRQFMVDLVRVHGFMQPLPFGSQELFFSFSSSLRPFFMELNGQQTVFYPIVINPYFEKWDSPFQKFSDYFHGMSHTVYLWQYDLDSTLHICSHLPLNVNFTTLLHYSPLSNNTSASSFFLNNDDPPNQIALRSEILKRIYDQSLNYRHIFNESSLHDFILELVYEFQTKKNLKKEQCCIM